MMGQQRGKDNVYGPWPWIVGLVLGFGIIWVMFALATGFS